MNLELPHETDTTHEAIATWLRILADAVDNSNSLAEHIATQCYRLCGPTTDLTRELLFDEIEDAMDSAMDMDVGVSHLARAVVDRLLPKGTKT